jgi:Tfp pilus assembly protein PilN
MIKVNLLAAVPGTAPAREWLPREQRSAFAGLGLLVVTAAIVGGFWYYLHRELAGVDRHISAAQTELTRLKVAAKLVDQTTARKTELTERLALIERLRAAKRAPVSLLETVSRSLPDGLWLLEMKPAGAAVQIDGRATSLTAVTDFAESLQNAGLFKHPVEILTTSTEQVDDLTVVRFSLKAEPESAEPPAAPAPARAPGRAAVAVQPGRTGA